MTHALAENLRDRLDSVTDACSLLSECEEAVVFGSVACECEDSLSDFDILLVGSGSRVKTKQLDIIWLDPRRVRSRWWLGSELANHVAAYGVWLKGEGSWRSEVFVSEAALQKKRRAVANRAATIYFSRDRLLPQYQRKLVELLVMDIYRLHNLTRSIPMPPRQLLSRIVLEDGFRTLDRAVDHDMLGAAFRPLLLALLDGAANDLLSDRATHYKPRLSDLAQTMYRSTAAGTFGAKR